MTIRSRVSIVALTLLLISSAPVLAAGADDFWVGVWQITIDGADRDTAFLVVTKAGKQTKPRYFTKLWEEQAMSEVRFEASKLRMTSVPRSRTVRLEFAPAGSGKIEGQWKMMHPQYPVAYPAHGVKRSSVPNFTPLAFQSQEDVSHVVDLNDFLLKKAPRKSFEEFKRFWITTVDPTFLPLFQDIVYPVGSAAGTNDEKIRAVFSLMDNSEFQENAARLAKEAKATIAAVKAKNPLLYVDNPIVLMPSLANEPVALDYIDRKLVVRLDTQRLCKKYQGDDLRAFLGRQQLKLPLYRLLPGAEDRLDAVMIREGMATRLAVSYGLAKTPEQCFGLPANALKQPAEKVALRRKAIFATLRFAGRDVVKAMLEAETPETREGLQVAYEFADRIISRFSMQEIMGMPPEQLTALLKDYLKEK